MHSFLLVLLGLQVIDAKPFVFPIIRSPTTFSQQTCKTYITSKSTSQVSTTTKGFTITLKPPVFITKTPEVTTTPKPTTSKLSQTPCRPIRLTAHSKHDNRVHSYYYPSYRYRYFQHDNYIHPNNHSIKYAWPHTLLHIEVVYLCTTRKCWVDFV